MYITNLTNVRYLTGFTGSAGSMLIINNEKHFFTDGRYIEQSKEQVKNCKIHIVGGAHFKFIADNNLIKNNCKLGFESDHMSVAFIDSLSLLKDRSNEVKRFRKRRVSAIIDVKNVA